MKHPDFNKKIPPLSDSRVTNKERNLVCFNVQFHKSVKQINNGFLKKSSSNLFLPDVLKLAGVEGKKKNKTLGELQTEI